ncbi:MAG: metal ABC transporter ATP-binding protein [Candidatus Moranbacteria bacterium]|nr:metal ABC transporter ATP-binding protein [Candidatus Moranbacteria bacterium]
MSDPILRVEHVSKNYGDVVALKDVSFVLSRGEYVGLIGPNGAGKSTLLKILLGIESVTSGVFSYASGVSVGYVPQHYDLSAASVLSVREVLHMSCGSGVDLSHILSHVGLSESFLSLNYHSLSGGQKQRVLIARALAHSPDLLFFDEPLSGVDYQTKLQIYDLLRDINLSHGHTILFVSHEIEKIVSRSDRVLCLNESLYEGCHPLSFARGHKDTCTSVGSVSIVGPAIHHHEHV